jgi:hypothetical protein
VIRSEEKLGLLVEARDKAREVSLIKDSDVESQPDKDAIKEAAAFYAAVEDRIPSIVVSWSGVADGVEVTLTIDGRKIPAAASKTPNKVNPGDHTVVASAPGYEDGKSTVNVGEGKSESVQVTLKAIPGWKPPEPPTPPEKKDNTVTTPPKRGVHPLVWVGLATTGAGLIAGGVGGGIALSKDKCAHDGIPNNCPQAPAWAADIGFGVAGLGAILTIIGIPLSLGPSAPAPKTAVLVRPFVAPGFVGVEGSF